MNQPRDRAFAARCDQPAALGQLRGEFVRQLVDRALDDDPVERRGARRAGALSGPSTQWIFRW